MIASRTDLAAEALEKSLEIREEADLDFKSPLNVFELCRQLTPSVRVLFVDYSMEGPQSDFNFSDADNDKEVAAHFRESVLGSGGSFEEAEPSIADQAPAVGEEPVGFYE